MNDMDKLLKDLDEQILNLGFDYDRLSESGQQTYTTICSIMAALMQ